MEIIIIGAGDIGYQLAKRLSVEKYNISLIESDGSLVEYAADSLDAFVIEGSGSSLEKLKEAGVENCDVMAALTDNDEVNILACKIAKKFGCETTIARVRNPEFLNNQHILSNDDFGVDFFIQPEKETAEAIVRLIKQSNATDIIEFDDGKIKLLGLRLDRYATVLNTKLKDLGQNLGNPPITVVAIKRRQFTIIPKGDDIFRPGDQIFMVCSPDYQDKALELLGKKGNKIEDILMIGGGMTATFIAEAIENDINLKIIEKDQKKAEALAKRLKRSLVINGDGSDLDLLTQESLAEMDEFVAITGDDETNIITSLVAHHLEVDRTITLVKKSEYLPLTPALSMDAVVSKQQITVNAIQKLIRRKQIAMFAELPGVDAEIVEFIASDDSKIVKKPIKDQKFPKGIIIGAVLRNNEMIIPKGDVHVQPDDKVIVFSKPEVFEDIEKYF